MPIYKTRISQPTVAALFYSVPGGYSIAALPPRISMSHGTTKPVYPTSTGLLAIRTPFVQPSDCNTQWKTTSISASAVNGTTFRTPAMISEPAATCYPSGWDEATPKSQLSFSPGVCPEGWVYNAMAESGFQVESTAFCCQRFGRAHFFPFSPISPEYLIIFVFVKLAS